METAPRAWLTAISTLVAALVGSFLAAKPMQAQTEGSSWCRACISRNACVDASGAGGEKCRIGENGCEELGDCNIDNAALAEALHVKEEDILQYETKQGTIKLLAVGRSRFAAWNCRHELTHLVQRRSDGKLVALDLSQHQQQYAYDRVLAAARQREQERATDV
jgi:hypothetical protein